MSKADYVKNLAIIYEVAHGALAEGGKIVWVTTTPISGGAAKGAPGSEGTGCNQWGNFSSCIDDYNAAANGVFAGKADVVTADLNAAVRDVCGQGAYEQCALQRWSNVHFTTAGKQFCAIHVAKNIAPLLAPKWAALVPDPKVGQ